MIIDKKYVFYTRTYGRLLKSKQQGERMRLFKRKIFLSFKNEILKNKSCIMKKNSDLIQKRSFLEKQERQPLKSAVLAGNFPKIFDHISVKYRKYQKVWLKCKKNAGFI